MIPMTLENLQRVTRIVSRTSDDAISIYIVEDAVTTQVSMSYDDQETWSPGFIDCSFNSFLSMMRAITKNKFIRIKTDSKELVTFERQDRLSDSMLTAPS